MTRTPGERLGQFANLLDDTGQNMAPTVATLAALQVVSTTGLVDAESKRDMDGRTSAGDGGEGRFVWRSGDQSANVAADEVGSGLGDGGIWIAPSSDLTGASGAWERVYAGRTESAWYGEIDNAVKAKGLAQIAEGVTTVSELINLQATGVTDVQGYGHATTVRVDGIPASAGVAAANTAFFNGAVGSSDRVLTRYSGMSFDTVQASACGIRASAVFPIFGDYLRFYQMGGRAYELNSCFYGRLSNFEFFEAGLYFTGVNNYSLMGGDFHGEDIGASSRYKTQITVTGITQANPAVVSSATTPTEGEVVYIDGVTGMAEINGKSYRVGSVTAGVSFELEGIDSSAYTAYSSGGEWHHHGSTLSNCDGITIGECTVENWDSCAAFLLEDCKGINLRDVWVEACQAEYVFRAVNTTDITMDGRYLDIFEPPSVAVFQVVDSTSDFQEKSTTITVRGGCHIRLRDDPTIAGGNVWFVEAAGNGAKAHVIFDSVILSQGFILLDEATTAACKNITLARSDWADDEAKFLETLPVADIQNSNNSWVPHSDMADTAMIGGAIVSEIGSSSATITTDSTVTHQNGISTKIAIGSATTSKLKFQHTMDAPGIVATEGESFLIFIRMKADQAVNLDFSLAGDFGNVIVIPQLVAKSDLWVDYVIKPSAAGSWAQGRFNPNKVTIEVTNGSGSDANVWIDRIDYDVVSGDIFLAG